MRAPLGGDFCPGVRVSWDAALPPPVRQGLADFSAHYPSMKIVI
jgi:hypothetical protein